MWLREENLMRTLKAAGYWRPIEIAGTQVQRFGYSKHVGYVCALIRIGDLWQLEKYDLEPDTANMGADEFARRVRRSIWLRKGGDPALLKELEL